MPYLPDPASLCALLLRPGSSDELARAAREAAPEALGDARWLAVGRLREDPAAHLDVDGALELAAASVRARDCTRAEAGAWLEAACRAAGARVRGPALCAATEAMRGLYGLEPLAWSDVPWLEASFAGALRCACDALERAYAARGRLAPDGGGLEARALAAAAAAEPDPSRAAARVESLLAAGADPGAAFAPGEMERVLSAALAARAPGARAAAATAVAAVARRRGGRDGIAVARRVFSGGRLAPPHPRAAERELVRG